jgi:hypothetical protein
MHFNTMCMRRAVLLLLLLLPATVVLSRHDQENQRDDRHLVVFKRPPYPTTERDYCVEPNKEFDTDVVVSFDGAPNLLGPSDYMDLENYFQEAYNSVRKGFCDDLSRKVVAVSVDDTSIEETSVSEFSLRFAVKVGCDRCGADTDLFFVPKVRRELAGNDGLFEQMEALLDKLDNGIHDRTDSRSLQQSLRGETISRATIKRPLFGIDVVPSGTDPTPPAPTPAVVGAPPEGDDDECCPPSGESRGPTGEEFALEFDKVYNEKNMGSARKLQGVPIEQVITAFEVSPIDCSESEEDFDTEVFVELSTSGDPSSILQTVALENSFQTSFNSFSQGELCDPLFRTVNGVVIENEEGRRSLASSSGRYKYKVKGKCRGCANGNTRLFGEGPGRRQLASAASHRWLYDRELRFMMSDDTCFCAVGAEERGVEEEEFTVVYNDDVVRLQEEGVLVNIDGVLGTDEDIPPTWSPTTSPTNFPTAPTDSPVPSPSPSATPT